MCSNRKQKPNESNKPLKQIKKNNNNDDKKKTHSIEKFIQIPIIGNEIQSKQWYLLYKELQRE